MLRSFYLSNTTTTEIYTLSLHDALPIWKSASGVPKSLTEPRLRGRRPVIARTRVDLPDPLDRKSTRLNSSHLVISYAVFCLKKKTRSRTCVRSNVRNKFRRQPRLERQNS